MSPFFSVIIPVYNRENYLHVVLTSLKNQTFKDFEVIIVDDCSTDRSYQIAEDFILPNKKVFRNEVNSERCKTRNRGIEEAKARYICFIDSDDYHLPEHFEKLHDFIIEHKEPKAFFFTNLFYETEDGKRTEWTSADFDSKNPFKYFLKHTVNPQRWAVHRDIIIENKFDPDVVICEDMDVTLRIAAKNYPFYQLKEQTTVYVGASDSFTNSDEKKEEKELYYYNRIFNRKELKGKLPKASCNRLISKCHYHLAVKANKKHLILKMYRHAFLSFLFYPKSYNGKTNKPLAIMCLYNIPILGWCFKKIRGSVS